MEAALLAESPHAEALRGALIVALTFSLHPPFLILWSEHGVDYARQVALDFCWQKLGVKHFGVCHVKDGRCLDPGDLVLDEEPMMSYGAHVFPKQFIDSYGISN